MKLLEVQSDSCACRRAGVIEAKTGKLGRDPSAIRDTPHTRTGLNEPGRGSSPCRIRHPRHRGSSNPLGKELWTMRRTHWAVRASTLAGGAALLLVSAC